MRRTYVLAILFPFSSLDLFRFLITPRLLRLTFTGVLTSSMPSSSASAWSHIAASKPERPSCATSRWLSMSRSIVLCLTNPGSMLLLRRWVRWRRQGRWHWPRGRRGRWPRAPVCFGSGRMFRRRWGRRFGGGHEAPIGGHFASWQGGHPV